MSMPADPPSARVDLHRARRLFSDETGGAQSAGAAHTMPRPMSTPGNSARAATAPGAATVRERVPLRESSLHSNRLPPAAVAAADSDGASKARGGGSTARLHGGNAVQPTVVNEADAEARGCLGLSKQFHTPDTDFAHRVARREAAALKPNRRPLVQKKTVLGAAPEDRVLEEQLRDETAADRSGPPKVSGRLKAETVLSREAEAAAEAEAAKGKPGDGPRPESAKARPKGDGPRLKKGAGAGASAENRAPADAETARLEAENARLRQEVLQRENELLKEELQRISREMALLRQQPQLCVNPELRPPSDSVQTAAAAVAAASLAELEHAAALKQIRDTELIEATRSELDQAHADQHAQELAKEALAAEKARLAQLHEEQSLERHAQAKPPVEARRRLSEEEAAVRISAGLKGMHVRRQVRRGHAVRFADPQHSAKVHARKARLQAEHARADAASQKIAAVLRGGHTRKEIKRGKAGRYRDKDREATIARRRQRAAAPPSAPLHQEAAASSPPPPKADGAGRMETLHEQGAEEAAHALADGEYDIHGRPLRAEDCARPQRPAEEEQPSPDVPWAHGGEPEDSAAPSLPATDRTAESDPPSLPRPNRIVISVLDDSPRTTPSIQSRKCGRCSSHLLS